MSIMKEQMLKAFEPEVTVEVKNLGKTKRNIGNIVLVDISKSLWDKYTTIIDGENRIIYLKRKEKS